METPFKTTKKISLTKLVEKVLEMYGEPIIRFIIKTNCFFLLIFRALKFTKDNFNGVIGKVTLNKEDEGILVQINRCLKQYVDLLEKCKEREAISQILNISR